MTLLVILLSLLKLQDTNKTRIVNKVSETLIIPRVRDPDSDQNLIFHQGLPHESVRIMWRIVKLHNLLYFISKSAKLQDFTKI